MKHASADPRAAARRRRFLAQGAALASLLLPAAGSPQTGARQVRDLGGEVWINGARADWRAVIRVGDVVRTGADGRIVFVVGSDAFMLRSGSELRLEGAAGGRVADVFRLVTGALGAAFGRSGARTVVTPSVTAGIRGTAVYAEARREETYFCTCHGVVQLAAGGQPLERVESQHHAARLVRREASGGVTFAAAPMARHTDAEIDVLEQVAGRRAPWSR
jgi:hypothetical protein